MATNIIMPALGMAQETGKLLSWLKQEGQPVQKGEPIMEIETDKATVEIEAPASGILSRITAQPGAEVPVGQVIAVILEKNEAAQAESKPAPSAVNASPVARKMAEERGIDLNQVKPAGGRISKEDVQAFLTMKQASKDVHVAETPGDNVKPKLTPASPKARRLAQEKGLNLADVHGTGPGLAVLAIDIPEEASPSPAPTTKEQSSIWQVMSQRMVQSWTTAPHFYLLREISAAGLVDMRKHLLQPVEKRTGIKPTFTDILVKLAAMAIREHPEINARWDAGKIVLEEQVNIGIAVGIEDGLTVPVIPTADRLSVSEITRLRQDLASRAASHKLHPKDLSGSTFTITNLGMYNVDAFLAVINPPQAAILSVGRIVDKVVPRNGQPAIEPMITLGLACDHRTIDGMRAAQFLDDLANLIMEPWGVLA